MIPTPDLSHLTSQDFDRIYEPAGKSLYFVVFICLFSAEDTFLLLDALEEDEAWLQAKKPSLCLEIG